MRFLAVLMALAICAALLFATGGAPAISSKFRMKADGKYIGGVAYMSGFGDSSKVITATVQGKQIKSAGPTSYGDSRGLVVVKQLNSSALPPSMPSSNTGALEKWYQDSQAAPGGLAKDFVVETLDEQGMVSALYKAYGAVPVRFTKETGADGKAYNVFSFTVNGIERDYEVS